MPDIFERYFAEFGKKPSDYYNLVRLDPSYKVVFNKEEEISLPANMQKLEELLRVSKLVVQQGYVISWKNRNTNMMWVSGSLFGSRVFR